MPSEASVRRSVTDDGVGHRIRVTRGEDEQEEGLGEPRHSLGWRVWFMVNLTAGIFRFDREPDDASSSYG